MVGGTPIDVTDMIDVRFGELLIPQDLVKIDSAVRKVADTVYGLPEYEAALSLWDRICRIRYPKASGTLSLDLHVLDAFPYSDIPIFGPSYRVSRSGDEFWQYPCETLDWGWGDCEDTAIALCALLRVYGFAPERVWVVVGTIPGGRHAWVELDGEILETTFDSVPALGLCQICSQYREHWRFNDTRRQGEIVFVPRGDERAKFRWIGARWQHPTKIR